MIRTAVRLVFVVLATGVLCALSLAVALHVGGATWAVNRVLQAINPYPHTTLRSTSVTGDFITGLTLHDVRLVREDGEIPFWLKTLQLRYDLRSLFRDTIVIHDVQFVEPHFTLHPFQASAQNRHDRDRQTAPPSSSRKRHISLQHISIIRGNALVHFGSARGDSILRIAGARIEGHDIVFGDGIQVGLGTVQLRFLLPGQSQRWGTLAARGSFPAPDQKQGAIIRLNARFSDGGTAVVQGRVAPPKTSPAEYQFRGTVRQLDLGLFTRGPKRPARINGDFNIDLHGPRLDQLSGQVRVKLHHSAYASFRSRRMVVEAQLTQGRARVGLEGDIGIAAISTQGWLRPFDTAPSYDLTARVRRHSKGAFPPWLDRLLGGTRTSLVLQVQGHHLNPRQADLRATGALHGSPRLADARATLRLRRGAARLTVRTALGGGALALDAATTLFSPSPTPSPTLTVERLRFRHLDLARLIPNVHLTSDLSGSGRASVRGRRLRETRISGRIVLEPSRVGTRSLTRGDLRITYAQGNLGFQVALDAPAGKLDVTGAARPFDATPSYAVRQGTFQTLDLRRLLGAQWPHTRLAGSLQAEGRGRRRGEVRINGTLGLEQSLVDRTAIQAGRLQVALAEEQLRLTGELLGEGSSVTVEAAAEPFAKSPRISLTSDLSLWNLASLLQRQGLDAAGTARLAVEGELGRRDSMRLRGELHATGRFGNLSVDSFRTKLRLTAGVLTVDTLSIRSNVGGASGAGAIALIGPATTGESRFRLDGWFSDLAPLAPLLHVDRLGIDSGRFTISGNGPRDRLHVQFGLQTTGLTLGPHRVRTVQASIESQLAANRAVAAGTVDLFLEGLVIRDTPIRTIRLQGAYQGKELALRGESVIDRTRRARIVTRVYPDSSEQRVHIDTLETQTPERRWTLDHPVEITYGERIRVNDFALTAGSRRLAVNGTVDRRGNQDLSVRLDSLQPGWIMHLFGIGPSPDVLDWEVNGSLHLAGAAAAPRVIGELAVALRPSSKEKVIGNAHGSLDWNGTRGLHFEFGIHAPKGDSLRLIGQIPLALSLVTGAGDSSTGVVTSTPRGELMLDATATDFRIEAFKPLLPPELIDALSGRLTVDAHARGSLEAPKLSGELALTKAKVRITRLGATYDKGEFRATLRGRELQLTQARIESGEGRLEIQGAIRLQPSTGIVLDLRSMLYDFQIAEAEQLRSRISGTLHWEGTIGAPTLAGSVQLQQSDLYLQMRNPAHSAEPVELTSADLRMLEERLGYVVVQPPDSTSGGFARWMLDLDVALAGNNWLRRRTDPVVAVELSGQAEVHKRPGEAIEVLGKIQPLPTRSFVQVLGRRFEVADGTVELNGPLKNARMRLRAEYRVTSSKSERPTVVITARMEVDTGQVNVFLSSTPPMTDADVKSYVITGQPVSTGLTEASDETGVLVTGAMLAVGAALGTVAGGAEQTLGLDVIQVLQDREGGQTLAAGKYVSSPLYLGFRQPIIAVENGRPEAAKAAPEFEVEYAALRWALLNFQGAGSEFRVFLRRRR